MLFDEKVIFYSRRQSGIPCLERKSLTMLDPLAWRSSVDTSRVSQCNERAAHTRRGSRSWGRLSARRFFVAVVRSCMPAPSMPQPSSLTKCAVACVLCALFSCVLVVSCRGAEEEMPSRSGGKGMGQHKTIWQQKQPETRCCGAAASTARCGRANELRQLNPIKRA